MDPEPDMLAEGRAQAERAGISNIEWRRGSSDDLLPALGQFRLVTMGNSFHWMDRQRTLDALYDLVTSGGGVAVVGQGAPLQAPPPTRWRVAINDVVRKYVGNRPLPWDQLEHQPEDLHQSYIERSRFTDLTSYVESFDVTWTIDSMIGNLYSMSFCSRRLLGDRVDAFERDLRAAIAGSGTIRRVARRAARIFRLSGTEALNGRNRRNSWRRGVGHRTRRRPRAQWASRDSRSAPARILSGTRARPGKFDLPSGCTDSCRYRD